MFNPYMTNMFPYPSNSPSPIEIPHVNGTNGAQAYQMPCNSSVLLLDDNAPIVYLVKTDSASYKTIKPYTITEYQPEPPVDVKSLLDRVSAIERRLNNESNTSANEPKQSNASSWANQGFDEHNTSIKQSNGSNAKFFGNKSNN